MKMNLNCFFVRKLSLPLLVERLPSLKRQSLFWKEDKDKSSGQMKVCRLFSICSADICLILCTHFYFVYCKSRKSLGSDDDFSVVVKTSASFDTDNCFQATLIPRDTSHNELYVFGLSLISCFHLERIQQLVRGFASDWKRSIENINQAIMRSFFNFKNGTTILRVSRSQRVATCKVNLVFGI